MKKLGVSGNPIILRVADEERMEEVVGICQENNWKFICGIEPDEPEDISDLEFMLDPGKFGGKRPKVKQTVNNPIVRDEPAIGRNEPCPCGSGKKYKKCCMRS